MLAVLSRYKLLLVVLLILLVAVLIWIFTVMQGGSKTPSRGVFVMGQTVEAYYPEGGCGFCNRL